MSRMNSYDRSLIIISKQNGWDPTQIQGGPPMPATHIHRESPFETDSKPIAGVDSPQAYCGDPGPQEKDWNAPDVSREKPSRTRNANPFPAMPGSR